MTSTSTDLSARTAEILTARHIPVRPPLHTLASVPSDVQKQLTEYLASNLITVRDWIGPVHQFLDDCNKALEDLDFFRLKHEKLYIARRKDVYPFCKMLSRKLTVNRRIDRVEHWKKVAQKLGQPEWLEKFEKIRADCKGVFKVSLVIIKRVTVMRN